MSSGYKLVVKFPDPSPSFVHGFEAGRLWQRMSGNERVIDETVHVENQELIMGMAMSKAFADSFGEAKDGWMSVQLVNTTFDADPHGEYFWVQRGGSEHVEMALTRCGAWFIAGVGQPLDIGADLRILGPAEPPELDGATP